MKNRPAATNKHPAAKAVLTTKFLVSIANTPEEPRWLRRRQTHCSSLYQSLLYCCCPIGTYPIPSMIMFTAKRSLGAKLGSDQLILEYTWPALDLTE